MENDGIDAMITPRSSARSGWLEHGAAGLALVWAALMLVLLFVAMPARDGAGTGEAFAASFVAANARAARSLFPLGITLSILVLVGLLRHGRYGSARGLLQIGATFGLLAGGFLSTSWSEPAVRTVVAAAATGDPQALTGPLADWARLRLVSLTLCAGVVVSLVAAARLPLPLESHSDAPGLTAHHRTLLFLLGTATLFHGYDTFVVSMALPYIGRDLGASERSLGFALSAIRIGALLSIVFGRLADRRGRRGILLFSVLAYTVATAATGLSHGIVDFVLFQLCAMTFLVTEMSLAQVVIAEEFPARFRSQGQGFLGAFDALGAGVAAMLFPLLIESALGWRGLYFIGVLPLLLVAYLRRSLPETARFNAAKARGEVDRSRLAELLEPHLRRRFLPLLVLAAADALAVSPAFAFASYHATNAFAFEPARVSAMILLAGGLGLAGWFVLGELAERLGRRPVGAAAMLGCGVAILGFYRTPWLQPSFALLVFMNAGVRIALGSLGTELFPTPLRSAAKSWITYVGVVGAMAGLGFVGLASTPAGGAAAVIVLLALVPIACTPLFLFLSETRGRELEEIAVTPISRPSALASPARSPAP